MHTKEVNPGGAEHPPVGHFGGHSREPRALSLEKPHPPFNAVDKGKALHEKRRYLVPEVCLEVSFVDFGGNVYYLSQGPLCGCKRSGATREETSAGNLTGLVRSVMQMEMRGQVTAKTSGLEKEKAVSSSSY